mmetsp:Transcript_17414/g.44419  ORF Transcript_17414/g.44419 Transcript_17414/m.44419 type:complete len:227 (-) Transcript_17414:2378-3058(-)
MPWIRLVHLIDDHLLRRHLRQLAETACVIGFDLFNRINAHRLLGMDTPVSGVVNRDGKLSDEQPANLLLIPRRRDQAKINSIGNHEAHNRLVHFDAALEFPIAFRFDELGHTGEIGEQISLGEREIAIIEANGAAHRQRNLLRLRRELHAYLSYLGPNGTAALDSDTRHSLHVDISLGAHHIIIRDERDRLPIEIGKYCGRRQARRKGDHLFRSHGKAVPIQGNCE